MDVPEAREAVEEAALLVVGQRRPQLCGDGPERIDGVAPVAAADLGHDGGAADEAQQLEEARRGVGNRDALAGCGAAGAMGVGEQAAARERDDLRAGLLRLQLERDVDHREAGADEQRGPGARASSAPARQGSRM